MHFEEKQVKQRNEEVGNIHLKPDTSDMILTLDADTVVYAVCSVCEAGDDESGYTINLEYAFEEACSRLDNIFELSGCKDMEVHFTSGKNFRFTLTPSYKSNRTERAPVGLQDLKKLVLEKYKGLMHTNIEADDYVSWQKKHWPELYLVGSPDKDVYNGNPGIHFNYYKRAKGKYIKEDIPMKWVETTYSESIVWVHMQVLMGDTSDGIRGIEKCGPAGAIAILCPELKDDIARLKKEHKEEHGKALASDKLWEGLLKKHGLLRSVIIDEALAWKRVTQAYTDAGMSEKEAILNMRLVNMHQIDEKGELNLWTQPTLEG